MTGPEQLPQFIRTLLTPMFMVTGAASMNWGLQRVHSTIIGRVRRLSDERLELTNQVPAAPLRNLRLAQIEAQLDSMTRRCRYGRNSIASFYAAILLFLACSVSIAVVGWCGLDAVWVCTFLFEAGMLFIEVALVYVLLDVSLSYRAVAVDSQNVTDSAEMVGANV
jgi:hypothetical protein